MRINLALLGATLVVCLVAKPALASSDDIGKSFQMAALALTSPQVNSKPAASSAVKNNVPAKRVSRKSVAKHKPAKKRTYERLVAKINLSTQTMNVVVNGQVKHSWKISSGAKGYFTPTGSYKPYYMTSMHYSKKYNNAPMPHSVFFRGGYAIHATGSVRRLGTPASHGCIRLSPGNARQFFSLVQKFKKSGTRIRISGATPSYKAVRRYARKKPSRKRNNSWANVTGYGNNYVSYKVRRRPASSVRRIRIGQSRPTRRRVANNGVFNWQF